MKKLIAMLLCVALVASLGVTSAFALTFTNAESADIYNGIVAFHTDRQAENKAASAMATEIERIQADYIVASIKIWNDPSTSVDQKKLAEKSLQLETQTLLTALEASDSAAAKLVKAQEANAFKFDPSNGYDFLDTAIETLNNTAKTEGADASYWDIYAAYYEKLAAADAEKAERDAVVAALIKGIDTTTPAGALLADATVAKYDAQAALKTAKAAADTAKKAIATAQKGAYTEAQAAVLDAQAIAYTNMAAEINTAVADYVDSVYVAIADFYASLG
jgi:hypothetical protein